jgi:hypothetical protein
MTAEKLVTVYEIGWEHELVDDDDGVHISYLVDEDGHRIRRRYRIPVRLTARQVFARSKQVSPETLQGLASGDLEALMELLDAMVGDRIIETVGTDPTVPTDEFLRFLNWLVDELKLADVLGGGPGN